MQLALDPATAAAGMLALARIGGVVMLMPGLGERVLPARQRMVIALVLVSAVLPDVAKAAPALNVPLPALMITEALLGLAIGTCARLVMSAMETAGSLIATNIGLSFAQVMDPTQGQQSEILATFFRFTGVMLILSADLHHAAIAGIAGSYQAFPLGVIMPAGDWLTLALHLISETFRAALGLAAPFIVFGFVFNLGLGLASKLTPQLQVFFLAMPLSVLLGLGALALTMQSTSDRFLTLAAEVFGQLFGGG